MKDLTSERTCVEEELRETEIFEPILVENLPASGETSRRVCLREVGEADAVVLILSERYGFVPETNNPEGLSVTHLEYREARRLKKPVFAFLYDGANPDAALTSFIQEVSDFDEGVLRKKWASTKDLREAVRGALLFWLARLARENGSEQTEKQAAYALELSPQFGEFSVVYDQESFQNDTLRNWRKILLNQLSMDCRRKFLPKPCLQELPNENMHLPTLRLRGNAASRSGRLVLFVEMFESPDILTLAGPVEVDVALTNKGAKFAAQLCLAFVLLTADDWSAGVDQILMVSRQRNCSILTKTRMLIIAANVSAINQGQRAAEIVERILELPKLDSYLVNAGVMALQSSMLRFEHKRAENALHRTQQLTFRFLKTAIQHNPSTSENLYNLAKQSLEHDSVSSLAFYSELLKADLSYEERWYFHRDYGLIYYRENQYEHAAYHYDRACHLKNSDSELFRFAGDAFYYRGKWAEALLRYERALALESVESYFLDAKIELCRARINIGKDSDWAYYHKRVLGNGLSKIGLRAAEASWRWLAYPLFLAVTRLCDVNFNAKSWLALYANRRGDYKEATVHLKSALAAVPENPITRLNLVMNLIFDNEGKFTDCAQVHAKAAIFHGGPETIDHFRLRLTNTQNKDELCEQFKEIFDVVRCERDEWLKRRREILKPERFGDTVHIEFR